MENASKALIIAGAILISILLISVGIIIMNAINDPVQQGASSADSQAIEIFNSKWTGYVGSQRATTIKALGTAIRSSNGANPDHQIDDGGYDYSSVNSGTTYVVTFLDNDNDGYFDTCQIAP
jgi:hypothetical protein